MTGGALARREGGCSRHIPSILQDCLFLSAVLLLSVGPYFPGLGFYSDYWSFVSVLSLSPDQSFAGLLRSLYQATPEFSPRPVEALYLSALYWLLGPHPLRWHAVNAAMLLAMVLLFYLALRQLGQQRLISIAVATLYGLLPHYSAARFFTLKPALCMALYFLSLYADLRVLRAGLVAVWGWKFISLSSLLASSLAYEVVLPLFPLNIFLAWYSHQRLSTSTEGGRSLRPKVGLLLGANLLALALVIVFKAATATRLDDQPFVDRTFSLLRVAFDFHRGEYESGLNIKHVLALNLGYYVTGFYTTILTILTGYYHQHILVLSSLFGLGIFFYLRSLYRQYNDDNYRGDMLVLFAGGLLVIFLGYAIFLTNPSVAFTITGINNRTAIAAAVGVSLVGVGVIGWVSSLWPSRQLRSYIFCGFVALLSAGGFLIINTIGSFWMSASRQQQEILTDIQRDFPTLPTGSTLLLDGVCPYVGPAIVFEASWDLKGALQMLYRDQTLRADVVTPSLLVKEGWISTWIYSSETRYPYGENLLVFNFRQKETYRLSDAESARRYLRRFNPDRSGGCPEGRAGYGVPVFSAAGGRPSSPIGAEWDAWRARGLQPCTSAACRPSGGVDRIVSFDEEITVEGWAAPPPGTGELVAAFLLHGDEPVAKAAFGYRRPDVARALQRPELANAGFQAVVHDRRTAALIADGTVCPSTLRVISPDSTTFSDLPVREEACKR